MTQAGTEKDITKNNAKDSSGAAASAAGRSDKASNSPGTASLGFEDKLWKAACNLRGNVDASEYKSVFLG